MVKEWLAKTNATGLNASMSSGSICPPHQARLHVPGRVNSTTAGG